MKIKNRLDHRRRRHLRLRKKIVGSAECPRMCVSISNRHMVVQFLDDARAHTIASCTTIGAPAAGRNLEAAKALGKRAAEIARAQGINRVVFDRAGHTYHGRVKVIAEAAREAGITL